MGCDALTFSWQDTISRRDDYQ